MTKTPVLLQPQEAGSFKILNLLAPPWEHWMGDATEADPMISSTVNLQGIHYLCGESEATAVAMRSLRR